MNIKTLSIVVAVIAGANAFAGVDDAIPNEAKNAITSMPDKAESAELLRAARVVVSRKTAPFGDYSNASKRLLESGNEELALVAIDDTGHWLSFLEEKKEWKPSDIKLLTRALLKMSLPDELAPGGEERSGRLGSVNRLAVLLGHALGIPLPSTEPLRKDPGNASSVRAWLREVLNGKLRDAAVTPEMRHAIQDSIAQIEKQRPLPAP
jgi:hypothetical protein